MLYLIGLGLDADSASEEALEALKKCGKIYLDSYTVDFPYSVEKLEENLKIKISRAGRSFIESLEFLKEAKKENVAVLVYGSPLTATTHITILQEAAKNRIKYRIFFNASVLDAVAETGLQVYKFGKIASMPRWEKNFRPESFVGIVKQNLSVDAHSLLLIDIGLEFGKAISQLKEAAKKEDLQLGKIAVCSRLGTKEKKIVYGGIGRLEKEDIKAPFCIIIPGKMHFVEEEMLESYSK